MLILIVIIILAIVFGCIVKLNNPIGFSVYCMFVVFLGGLFVSISALVPPQYSEPILTSEWKLNQFVENDKEYYVALQDTNYIGYLVEDSNKPMTFPINTVSSLVYIDQDDTSKVLEYIKKCEWTWYAAPIMEDKVNYVLYIPEGSIFYGSTK